MARGSGSVFVVFIMLLSLPTMRLKREGAYNRTEEGCDATKELLFAHAMFPKVV